MKRFTSSVQHITGQAIDVVAGDQKSRSVVEEELEVLRAKVEELSDEVWLSLPRVGHVLIPPDRELGFGTNSTNK